MITRFTHTSKGPDITIDLTVYCSYSHVSSSIKVTENILGEVVYEETQTSRRNERGEFSDVYWDQHIDINEWHYLVCDQKKLMSRREHSKIIKYAYEFNEQKLHNMMDASDRYYNKEN